MRIGGVAAQLLVKKFRLENINPHADERAVGMARHRRRIPRFFHERENAVVLVDMHDAEAGRLAARYFKTADRHIGALVHMLLQHRLVIHFINMVAGEQHDIFRVIALDDVEVLIDGVGRAEIPVIFRDALARRENVEAFVTLGAKEAPAALQMADEAVRLILRRDADAPDAGIERIGEREIDDARLAAEIDRGLGAPVGQLHQPRAAAAGEHIGHGVTRERRILKGGHHHIPSMAAIRFAVIVDHRFRIRRTKSRAAAEEFRRRPESRRERLAARVNGAEIAHA